MSEQEQKPEEPTTDMVVDEAAEMEVVSEEEMAAFNPAPLFMTPDQVPDDMYESAAQIDSLIKNSDRSVKAFVWNTGCHLYVHLERSAHGDKEDIMDVMEQKYGRKKSALYEYRKFYEDYKDNVDKIKTLGLSWSAFRALKGIESVERRLEIGQECLDNGTDTFLEVKERVKEEKQAQRQREQEEDENFDNKPKEIDPVSYYGKLVIKITEFTDIFLKSLEQAPVVHALLENATEDRISDEDYDKCLSNIDDIKAQAAILLPVLREVVPDLDKGLYTEEEVEAEPED
jgi:hypothetical protein